MHTAKAETRLDRLIYSGHYFSDLILTHNMLN